MRYTISGLECKHQQFELIEIFDFITQLEELKKKKSMTKKDLTI